MKWKKKTSDEIKDHVFDALHKNVNYLKEHKIGVPASYLDAQVFSQDNTLLKDAPFLSSLVANPNHIGCHTLSSSESFFTGTQEIEREVISICAEDILKCNGGEYDGYVASGGTEANIQAIWVYRNYYQNELHANHGEIAIICSSDSHYSMDKAANLLNISIYKVQTDSESMEISPSGVSEVIEQCLNEGKKYFIVVANMMTTMFGSIDNTDFYTNELISRNLTFKLHIDGAFGGFYYPFSNEVNKLNFQNEYVSSVTLDAHKMAQAPYGTGIFIVRKGLIHHTTTIEASYVKGEDSTLIGSRSGANAVAIWMILSTYGPNGWYEKILILQRRTEWFTKQLDNLQISYFRDPSSNIVTIHSEFVPEQIAEEYGLVPDSHKNPKWYKVVVMEHVSIEKLEELINSLQQFIEEKTSL